MTGRKVFITALAVIAFFNPFLPSAAYSRVLSVTVSVDGMACPFCAYGVEKKLKKVDGVGSISVDLEAGKAVMTAAEDGSIDLPGVPVAVRKSGFTPGRIQATATGGIERSDADGFTLVPRDAGESFTLIAGGEIVREALVSSAESGGQMKLTGAVQIGPDGGITITPETVEEYVK